MKIYNHFRNLRRFLLNVSVPEIVWPKTVNLDSTVIPIRGMPFSFGIKRYLVKGNYESPERILVNKYVRSGDIVLEMGASIGILTSIIATKVGKNGKVVSIEASSKLARISEKWLSSRYANIQIICAYAFPVKRSVKNLMVKFVEGNGSLGGKIEFVDDLSKDGNSDKNFFISDCLDKFGFEPTIAVIDIEGTEAIVLKEELFLPDAIRVIIIELHPNIYNTNVQDAIIKRIEESGFSFVETIENVYAFLR